MQEGGGLGETSPERARAVARSRSDRPICSRRAGLLRVTAMRLRTEFWVKAYIRRCAIEGAAAVVVRHGDDDAGAIIVKVDRLDNTCLLFGPAPAGLDGADSDRRWVPLMSPAGANGAEADAFLAREASFD